MAYYVLDENNNKVEAFDKEGVLALLEKAIADGSLADIVENSAFVTKLKCCVGGVTYNIAFVTQAKYNELQAAGELKQNTYYFITDDSSPEALDSVIEELQSEVAEIKENTNKEITKIKKYDFSHCAVNEFRNVSFKFGKTYLINVVCETESLKIAGRKTTASYILVMPADATDKIITSSVGILSVEKKYLTSTYNEEEHILSHLEYRATDETTGSLRLYISRLQDSTGEKDYSRVWHFADNDTMEQTYSLSYCELK